MFHDIELTLGLLPGQGSYRKDCLGDFWRRDETAVKDTFQAVDAAAEDILGRPVGSRIFQPDSPGPDELLAEAPDVLQLAIYGTSVAVFGMLEERGARFSALLGHSMGEIAALVCGGAISVRAGAEILCHRITALRELDTSEGRMLALACDPERAALMLELVGDPRVVVAVENGPKQTVVAGPVPGLRRVADVAAAVGDQPTMLRSPHPFHNGLLAAARDEFVSRIAGHTAQPLSTPVFSPILGRFYRDGDDLAELLGRHLVEPVRFSAALRRFHETGARVAVEVGAGGVLSGLCHRAHPDITTLAPLEGYDRGAQLQRVASFLRAGTLTANGRPLPEPSRGDRPTTPAGSSGANPVSPRLNGTDRVDAPADPTPDPSRAATVAPSRDVVFAEVRSIYVAALEYPEEVFTEDALLEADLGVDSVKQTELIGRLREHYRLGPPPENFRLADFDTVGKVVDLVHGAVSAGNRDGALHDA